MVLSQEEQLPVQLWHLQAHEETCSQYPESDMILIVTMLLTCEKLILDWQEYHLELESWMNSTTLITEAYKSSTICIQT